jgi:hypothetical protein
VKHFDPGPPKSLLKNFLRAAEIYSQTNNMPVTLVIVLGEDGHIRITQKIILEMRESGDLPGGTDVRVVIGKLDELGWFEERFGLVYNSQLMPRSSTDGGSTS